MMNYGLQAVCEAGSVRTAEARGYLPLAATRAEAGKACSEPLNLAGAEAPNLASLDFASEFIQPAETCKSVSAAREAPPRRATLLPPPPRQPSG